MLSRERLTSAVRVRQLRHGADPLSPSRLSRIRELVAANHIFHWHLEFPDVFSEDGQGGFDCLLGNPPWEHTEIKDKEWFVAHGRPDIANAPNDSARKRMIASLATAVLGPRRS